MSIEYTIIFQLRIIVFMTWIHYVGTFFSIVIDPQPGAKYVETSRSFKKSYIDYIRLTAKPGKIWYTRHLCLTNIMI